jgi:hypothetical protein
LAGDAGALGAAAAARGILPSGFLGEGEAIKRAMRSSNPSMA